MSVAVLLLLSVIQYAVAFDEYSVCPKGKVWDYDAAKNEWNIIDHSSVAMAIRMCAFTLCNWPKCHQDLGMIWQPISR